jgi:hypothetical protein
MTGFQSFLAFGYSSGYASNKCFSRLQKHSRASSLVCHGESVRGRTGAMTRFDFMRKLSMLGKLAPAQR